MDYQNCSRVSLEAVSDIDELVDYTAELLKADGVLLTPTDTVYGLVCLPASEAGIRKIFEMKGRPLNRHLPIISSDWQQARDLLPIIWNEPAEKLAEEFWPGALTLACGIRENSIAWLSGRVEAGIRVPDHVYIRKLAAKLGPLLMTSANKHGEDTPHTLEGALGSLLFPPSLAVDGGLLSGAPSTLVNVNLPTPVIERAGAIAKSDIEKVLCSE